MDETAYEVGDRVVSHYYGPGSVVYVSSTCVIARWDSGVGESFLREDDPAIVRRDKS